MNQQEPNKCTNGRIPVALPERAKIDAFARSLSPQTQKFSISELGKRIMHGKRIMPGNRIWQGLFYGLSYLAAAGVMTFILPSSREYNVFTGSLMFLPVGFALLFYPKIDFNLIGYFVLAGLAIWGIKTKRTLPAVLFLMSLAACIGGCFRAGSR